MLYRGTMILSTVQELIEALRAGDRQLHRDYPLSRRLRLIIDASTLMKGLGEKTRDFCLLNPENLILTPCGTLFFAPERGCGSRFLRLHDPTERQQQEVFCLGFFTYQLLALRNPYPTEGSLAALLLNLQHGFPRLDSFVVEHQAPISKRLADIVEKSLAIDPKSRFASVEHLEMELQNYLSQPEAREANRAS